MKRNVCEKVSYVGFHVCAWSSGAVVQEEWEQKSKPTPETTNFIFVMSMQAELLTS